MLKQQVIERYEHETLLLGQERFSRKHLNALQRLNDLHDGRYFEPIAKGIRFNQYVGVIQIDGLTILIHPKADRDSDREEWRGVLLKMLKATGRLKPRSTGDAIVKRQHLNLLELYFELFLSEVDLLIRQGLIKQYRKRTANTLALKGKLEFAGHIARNVVHQERFYTTHQVYDRDHLLHRILACALDIIEQFCRGSWLYDRCRRVLLDFPELRSRTVTMAEFNNCTLNRKSAVYERALELARLIILNYSPDIHKGQEKMLSLLFDMNQLWEEYILKQVKRYVHKKQIGYTVIGQDKRRFWEWNTLRPDIVISNDLETFIIDTKWKRPRDKGAKISDLRQMYAYNKFWNAKRAMLLYPGHPDGEEFSSFHDATGNKPNQDNQCKLGFVHVLEANREEIKLDTEIGKKVFYMIFQH